MRAYSELSMTSIIEPERIGEKYVQRSASIYVILESIKRRAGEAIVCKYEMRNFSDPNTTRRRRRVLFALMEWKFATRTVFSSRHDARYAYQNV